MTINLPGNFQTRLFVLLWSNFKICTCQLEEKEYFGLAVVDESSHYTWLQLDRKALDHDLPRKPATATLTVHFLVPNLLCNAGILNNVMTS